MFAYTGSQQIRESSPSKSLALDSFHPLLPGSLNVGHLERVQRLGGTQQPGDPVARLRLASPSAQTPCSTPWSSLSPGKPTSSRSGIGSARQDAICQVTDKNRKDFTLTIQPSCEGGCIDKYKINDWVIIIILRQVHRLKHYNHESIN